MVALNETAVLPAEGWERGRDRLRAGLANLLSQHPGARPLLARARVWALWGALILLVVTAIALPRYRHSLAVYAACFWILIVWFALARTKTVSWSGLARIFSLGVAWSWVIAGVSYRLADQVGLRIRDDGPGTAIAAFTEESLKLLPVIALALIAPGRVRRFAAVDWLLVGLATGLGFQAWEDLIRRLVQSVTRPGLLDLLLGDSGGPGSGSPQYGWGPLSGGSGKWSADEVYGYAGHHIFTALVTATVGLGIAAWRHSNRTANPSMSPAVRWGWRAGALLLPALAWSLVIIDHFSYNATLNDSQWLDGETSAPWLIRAVWSHLGHGTGMGWLLLLVLVAALLVDAARLHAAGPATDLPGTGPPATDLPGTDLPGTGRTTPGRSDGPRSDKAEGNWLLRPRVRIDGWIARAPTPPERWRPVLVSLVALVVHVGRDLTVLIAAHARDGDREGDERGDGGGRGGDGGGRGGDGDGRRGDGDGRGGDGDGRGGDDDGGGGGDPGSRWAAIGRGRAAGTMLRQIRAEALTQQLTPDRVDVQDVIRDEVRTRRRIRLLAVGALGLVLLVGLIVAAQVARGIGTDLTPGNGLLGWLAGQFDSLGRWWAARSGGEKILIGVGVAALIALSGGSLGLAFGVSGALTYTAEHAQGAATFIRDPAAATRSWLNTTTPAAAALDLAEFGLTFAPGNFAGAAAGRGIRSAVREYLDDPAAFLARRRAALEGDRGSIELPGRKPDVPGTAADHPPRSWPDNPEPGTPEYDLGWDPAVQRFRPPEYRTAARVMDDYDVTLTRAEPGQAFDWVDEAGRSYDAVGGFPGRFLDQQWDSFTGQIVRHLDKADLIPVDVSGFSPEQIVQVQEFIAPLGPRVFIVGG